MRMQQLLLNRMTERPSAALAVGEVMRKWTGGVQSNRVVIAHEAISQAYEC
jgi:hypothetical protein